VRQHFVKFLGIAMLLCPAAISDLSAQSGFHPRWEIPGFDFHPDGGWRVKARQVSLLRQQLLGQGNIAMLNAMRVGPAASAAVSGTLVVPAVFFAYANTDPSFMSDTAQYTAALFSSVPPGANPYTLRTLYEQMSNNTLSMTGRILGWVRLANNEVTYTGVAGTCTGNPYHTTNCNGIFSGAAINAMQTGFREALAAVDNQVDFGQFDNDGPDGIPNSGDDDGYVDMIMFAHPTKDGACGGFPDSSDPATNNHIWSHRYSLLQEYVTNDHSNRPGFGNIRVRDYFTTSARGGSSACDITQIMPIGTAAHEFGHALGLPDLYDTVGPTEGSGEWGLMGSGNFTSPRSPSRMESWSLNELGWVTIQQLTTSGVYQLDPVATSRTAAYLRPPNPNPRGEYFLLENRQASLADTALIRIHCARSGNPPACGGGLMIWHVDSTQIANHGFRNGSNTVNYGGIHGLTLQEADGLRQLWCGTSGCNRGDAGDPYPGTTGNTSFVYRTNPAALLDNDSSFAGLAVDQITQTVPGGTMSFRVRFGSLTVARASDTAAVVQFDAAPYNVFRDLLDQGSSHAVGFTDGQLSADGRRRWRFVSWSDGGAKDHTIVGTLAGAALTASVVRDFLLKATAAGGGTVQADTTGVDLTAGVLIPENRTTTLSATPTSAPLFCGWIGDTTVSGSSLVLGMQRSYIVAADFGSTPALTSGSARPNGVMGAAYADTLRISGGGSTLTWTVTGGALPTGVTLDAATGRLSGFPRQLGNFSYQAQVASCGTASQTFTLSVTSPTLATADVTAQLLGPTSPLTADQVRYLDFLGNNNGLFDIGDFLAWVKATGAPLSAAALQTMQRKGGPR